MRDEKSLKTTNFCFKKLNDWCNLLEIVLDENDPFELTKIHYQQLKDGLINLKDSLDTISK